MFAHTLTTNIIDLSVKAVIKRRSAKGNTRMRSVRPGGIFVNRAVTTLQVTVQTPTWSVAVVRLILVVAQTVRVQTAPTTRPQVVRAVRAVRANRRKWNTCGMLRRTVTTSSIPTEPVNGRLEGYCHPGRVSAVFSLSTTGLSIESIEY